MTKSSVQEFSTTPANNTDIAGINVNTGWSPANVGPAFRTLMAQVGAFAQPISIALSGTAVTLTAAQASALAITFTGSLSASCTVTIPAGAPTCGWVTNATSGSQNVILTTGSGTTLTIAPGPTVMWTCDGTNVAAIQISLSTGGNVSIGGNLAVTGTTTLTGDASVGGIFSVSGISVFASTINAVSAAIVAGGLTVTSGGTAITGNSSVNGTLIASNGIASTQVVNYSQFPATLSATGTQTLPSGYIEKWGIGTTSAGAATVTFATAFPTACLNVQLTLAGASAPASIYSLIAGTLSTTGFPVYGAPASSDAFYWRAIGY